LNARVYNLLDKNYQTVSDFNTEQLRATIELQFSI
jgi:outer membrane cobalamin receptor